MTKKWKYIWSRKYAPYVGSAYLKSFTTQPGFDFCKNKLFVPKGELQEVYFEEKEFDKLIKNITNFLLEKDIGKFAVEYEERFIDFLNWARQFTDRDFSKFSNKELVKLFNECSDKLEASGEDQFISFVVLEGPGREVENFFKDRSEILQWIATPYRETRLNKIRMELLNMVAENRISETDLQQYIKKYAWMSIYDIIDEPLTLVEVKKQIESITDSKKEIQQYKNLQDSGLKAYKNFLGSIEDVRLKKLVEIIHYFSYLKEMRDDYRREVYYLLKPFFTEIGERADMNLREINFLLREEIFDLLKGNDSDYKNKANARQKQYSLLMEDGAIFIFDYGISREYIKRQEHTLTEIKGTIANKGKANGKVKIIFHKGDFNKFTTGDILVTPMTHPEFLPIMKMAGAIVTDEGGLTCHAAIIAREMQKPCVIGTKIATQVFKDGDMVEVDAEKGVVRKIK